MIQSFQLWIYGFWVAELVKSFEPRSESPKVLTTSATEETIIFSFNAALRIHAFYQDRNGNTKHHQSKQGQRNRDQEPDESWKPHFALPQQQ